MGELILFADNNQHFLKSRKRYLEREGYHVIPAATVSEAERVIERGGLDVAILDLRLRDDGDERDLSGLAVARRSDPTVPKILLTSFPTIETVRQALGPSENGKPIVEDLIEKKEDPSEFLARVRRVVERRRAEKQVQTFKQMESVVGDLKRLMVDPVLDNYSGFFCMRLTSREDGANAPDAEGIPRVFQGELCKLIIWLQPDEPDEDVFSERINIPDGRDSHEVNFEVVLDSSTIEFSVNRETITVRPRHASRQITFTFASPSPPGEQHELWAKVFQKNRLIQIVKGAVQVDEKGG